MTEYTLRGEALADPFTAWAQLGEVFGLTAEERSLDGLWEKLCALPTPFCVHVTGWSEVAIEEERFADQLLELLGDFAEEEEEFSFDVTE